MSVYLSSIPGHTIRRMVLLLAGDHYYSRGVYGLWSMAHWGKLRGVNKEGTPYLLSSYSSPASLQPESIERFKVYCKLSRRRIVWLLHHPPPPSPVSKFSLCLSFPVCRWSSWYKSFNTLCPQLSIFSGLSPQRGALPLPSFSLSPSVSSVELAFPEGGEWGKTQKDDSKIQGPRKVSFRQACNIQLA